MTAKDKMTPMITVERALKIIARETPGLTSERISLGDSIGRVLAGNIVADTDMPPFHRSQMDGYAVKAADTESAPVPLRLVGESAAGRGWRKTLRSGEAVRIMTGAPVPNGANAVQKIELAGESGDTVTINEPTSKGRFIVPKGKEIKKGKVVLKSGSVITANNIAVPAAFGYDKVKVARSPLVAILSTGSEIIEISKRPKRDQIRNSNSLMLKALCEQVGAEATVLPHVGDNISDLKSQISDAARSSDVLITTGGVSVGKYDLTKLALRELGAEMFFERVRLKPGKPTVFAKLKKTSVFGLPGNPVSATVTFHLFVRSMLLRMQGASCPALKTGEAVALGNFKATPERDAYMPGKLGTDDSGRLTVVPIDFHGSSDFIGFASADVLVKINRGNRFTNGDVVPVLFLF